ncbi:MAG TPA: cell division protein [Propionibacteriaceae bacterium]|nr:ABC transporter permease [Micropruina sp.]HBX81241.1 cell division protein [Propionibacteriaceae bacterium]HBY23543.1 cell division protein [Propionibacteriaceae bacterium]
MTIAVIVTMAVSLSLFGAGILAAQQVDLLKGKWYDKIEITVFLCTKDSKGKNCDPGNDITEPQRQAVKSVLDANPEVQTVFYESKAESFEEFKEVYKNSPILESMSVDLMQDSFRIKLKNPEEYQGVVSAVSGLKGVQNVVDLHEVLDPLFEWLNLAKWGTIGFAGLLLLAAALQIGNTIRMAAFSRRRELGIMRLVGASNLYIMLPFLLESLVAAVAGALIACGVLTWVEQFVIIGKAQVALKNVAWIGWPEVGIAMLAVVAVGAVLSIIPTLIATRKYLRV